MIRKNPIEDRGPAPAGGRPTPQPLPLTLFQLRPEEEYNRLWKVLLESVNEQIALLDHYESIAVPGFVKEDWEPVRKQLESIIQRRS